MSHSNKKSLVVHFIHSLNVPPLQVKKHSSYLMTVEMSIVGSLCLLVSTLKSPDGEAIKRHGFFHGWTALTMVITISNSWTILLMEKLLLLIVSMKCDRSYRFL